MNKPILFTKRGCVPCSNLKRFLLTETELDYEEIDVDKEPQALKEYDIMSVPTLIIGDKRTTGFDPHDVMQLINEVK
ncbi:glutaredoxin family protein [Oceanobacillus sp. FSL H7-0719]|uniref:glutaredoxin family protein n=1 Tax=Oceanobacillus sp. FSL H7-0719 TaxID=2954507 RepID=UPI00324EDCFD